MIKTLFRPAPVRRAGILSAHIGAAVLLATSGGAQAGQPTYNYLEASWLNISPKAGSEDASGYQALLSSPLEPGNFLRASYSRSKLDDSGAKTSALSAGLGLYSPMQANTDVYGLVSYEEVDQKSVSKGKGYSLELGFRWLGDGKLEFGGGGRYLNLDDSGDELQWFADVVLALSPAIALSGHYAKGDDDSRYTLGLRFFSQYQN